MATLADVENAFVGAIATALFPDQVYQPLSYAASALAGLTIKLYRGWPDADRLNKDLAAGIAHVSVFPESITRLVTRYIPEWEQLGVAVPTLTASVSGRVVTFGGTGGTGQAAGVAIGDAPHLAVYPYRVSATDTPATVATAMAALIPAASATGPALTVAGTLPVQARVVADQTIGIETRRQVQQIRVTVWCPDPHSRDTVTALVDGAFAGLVGPNGNPIVFLVLADGTKAKVEYRRSYTDDVPSRDTVWRHDLCYGAEYPTMTTQVQPEMLFGVLPINSGAPVYAA